MRIMITGATGMLGQDVLRILEEEKHACLGVCSKDFDLQDAQAVKATVLAFRPDAIVHCAAYTAVDLAESEPQVCMGTNSMGSLNLARAASVVGAKLLYVSTDYVFDGSGDTPWEASDRPSPLNVYGLSKLQGEEAVRALVSRHFILRTSWLFGRGGRNFVSTIRRLGQERAQISVVDDQRGAPTYTVDLARLIARMIVTDRYGIYHAANTGCCSFAELAQMVLRAEGSRCRIQPIPTAQYPSAARRPLNSRLSMRALTENGFDLPPTWEDALHRYLAEES